MMRHQFHKIARQAGFTLIELLVAVSLFGVIAAISYQALDTAILSSQHNTDRASRLARINQFFSIVAKDLMQSVNRPVRDSNGDTLAGVVSEQNYPQTLEFTHHGRIISLSPVLYTLQRTRYVLDDDNLYRETWEVLDRDTDSAIKRQLLLKDVISISFDFHDPEGSSQTEWPYLKSGQENDVEYLPAGITMTIELEPYGSISRKFLVNG